MTASQQQKMSSKNKLTDAIKCKQIQKIEQELSGFARQRLRTDQIVLINCII